MANWMREVLLVVLVLVVQNEAATTLFLQAITSALATIPFTGGPMTTGLIGAKLSIGTKLLFYLGYFGRQSKRAQKFVAPKNPSAMGGGGSLSGLHPFPLPYMLSGGYPGMSNSFQTRPSFQASYGFDPAQLFQVLTSQGVDPNIVMDALNYAGSPSANGGFGASVGNAEFGASSGFGTNGRFERNGGFGGSEAHTGFRENSAFRTNGMNPDFRSNAGFSANDISEESEHLETLQGSDESQIGNKLAEGGGSEDVESFFAFLQDMDENTCISRLICDIGHNPSFLGEFTENIHSMVSTLNVQQTTRAYQYMEIMEMGRKGGQCKEKFPECSDISYDIVKNVAPSVGLPQNINGAAID